MEPKTIYFLIFLAIASPLIWRLMWREDFDGMQSEWRYRRERKSRKRLSPHQFYEHFYGASEVKEEIIVRQLSLHAKVWHVEPELIRPHDNYPRIFGDVDCDEFLDQIQSDFSVTIPGKDLEQIDGSFNSIAKYIADRLQHPAQPC